MKNFIYQPSTRMIFGRGAELEAGREIRAAGGSRVLLHYGGGSAIEGGLLDRIRDSLDKESISSLVLGGVEPNPKLALVRQGIKLCRQEKVDFILAIGGGSVIDSAKAIGVGLANDQDPWEMIMGGVPPRQSFPLGAVPTLAAAGSETSYSMVITNTENWLKRSLNHDRNRPVFALMNPELTATAPAYATACGIVDIMMHTLERYVGPDRDTELTDRIAEGLLLSVKEAGTAVMKNLQDYEARATLLLAASLSHNGLTGLGRDVLMTAHKIEHEISAAYDRVAHGAGLAAIYPAWLTYIHRQDPERLARLATSVFGIPEDRQDPVGTALAGIQAMKEYFQSISMPTSLRELDIPKDSLPGMAEKCTAGGNLSHPSYFPIGQKEVLEILHLAY